MKIIGIIPARFASTRFPGKPLVEIHGMTMVQRVLGQAKKANGLHDVLIATDDSRIFDHVSSLGAKVVMTSETHPSGTDRCLEALEISGIEADAVINIQGDEPFVDPVQIDAVADLLKRPGADIATLVKRIGDKETLFDPNKVKAIFSDEGKAIYFSRHAIPFQKGRDENEWLEHFQYFKHIGLYGYKVNVLREICALKPSQLELAESLEQLRWLENGRSIFVSETHIETPAIDTPEDLKKLLINPL